RAGWSARAEGKKKKNEKKKKNQPDKGPTKNIAELLQKANKPKKAIVGIGATRYTEVGETHFLQPGDTSIVGVYNGSQYSADQIVGMANNENFAPGISAL
ncbi:DUF5718 family protein, partial [[Pasteurella] aerogenes]